MSPGRQKLPPEHVPPAQHGLPLVPHATHITTKQAKPELQTLPAQQTWPEPPQIEELLQVPPLHDRPLVQAEPAQHGCDAPPHATHTFDVLQTKPDPVHALPAQHGWPAPPHAGVVMQLFVASHVKPEAQVDPVQQGCPALPHAAVTHRPPDPHM